MIKFITLLKNIIGTNISLFNFRIKVTHILETHEIDKDKVDVISTEVMNTIIRSFIEDKTPGPAQVPSAKQKVALATEERQLVKFGKTKPEDTDTNTQVEWKEDDDESTPTEEYGEDDPDSPENKEFIQQFLGGQTENTKNVTRTKPNAAIIKKIPSPISRLSS